MSFFGTTHNERESMKKTISVVLVLILFLLQSCMTVPPYEREHLADPIMRMPSGLPGEEARFSFLSKTGEHCSEKGSLVGGGSCPACGN